MPNKKNRAPSGQPDHEVLTVQQTLRQPTEKERVATITHLPDAVNRSYGGGKSGGGKSSKVGRLAHGTDTNEKISPGFPKRK